MAKLFERIVVALIIFFVAAAVIGIYVTWSACDESGGVAVRGMFGIECMKR